MTVSLGDHGQLFAKREDLHVEHGAASEEASQRGEQRAEDRLHLQHATASGQKKSTETIGTRFLVGTGPSILTLSIHFL